MAGRRGKLSACRCIHRGDEAAFAHIAIGRGPGRSVLGWPKPDGQLPAESANSKRFLGSLMTAAFVQGCLGGRGRVMAPSTGWPMGVPTASVAAARFPGRGVLARKSLRSRKRTQDE